MKVHPVMNAVTGLCLLIACCAVGVDAQPSEQPSSSPTCDQVTLPTEICFAIDESGSICQVEQGAGCTNCNCIDDGRDEAPFPPDFCCDNFKESTDFTADLVRAYQENIPDLEVAVRFFSTRVNNRQAPGLQDPELAIEEMENHVYVGGSTYTGGAFEACREILLDGKVNAQKFLILVTDGDPTVFFGVDDGGVCDNPDNDDPCETDGSACNLISERCADEQAVITKDGGINIIPIGFGNTVSQENLDLWAAPGRAYSGLDLDDASGIISSVVGQLECEVDGTFQPTVSPSKRRCLENEIAFDFAEGDGGWLDAGDNSRHRNFDNIGRAAWRVRENGAQAFTRSEDLDLEIPPNTEFMEVSFNYCTTIAEDLGNSRWEATDSLLLQVQFSNDGGGTYQDLDFENNQFQYGGTSSSRCGYDTVLEILDVPSDATNFLVTFQADTNQEGEAAYILDVAVSFCGSELSQEPSVSMSPSLSVQPSSSPSVSMQPSQTPTISLAPTVSESPSVSVQPSQVPSMQPSQVPSDGPTTSQAPSGSVQPSQIPSKVPSDAPSSSQAPSDSVEPSQIPSKVPSDAPSSSQAPSDSVQPSQTPTVSQEPTTSQSPSTCLSMMQLRSRTKSPGKGTMAPGGKGRTMAPNSMSSTGTMGSMSSGMKKTKSPGEFCDTKSPGKGTKSPGKGTKAPGKGTKAPGKGTKAPGKGQTM